MHAHEAGEILLTMEERTAWTVPSSPFIVIVGAAGSFATANEGMVDLVNVGVSCFALLYRGGGVTSWHSTCTDPVATRCQILKYFIVDPGRDSCGLCYGTTSPITAYFTTATIVATTRPNSATQTPPAMPTTVAPRTIEQDHTTSCSRARGAGSKVERTGGGDRKGRVSYRMWVIKVILRVLYIYIASILFRSRR